MQGVGDANAAAQLRALEALVALLEVEDEGVASRIAKDAVTGEAPQTSAAPIPDMLPRSALALPQCCLVTTHAPSPSRPSGIVGKALTGRPPNVLKASEVCLLLAELGQAGAVVEGVARAFAHKTPKVATAALNVAVNAVALFG